MLVEPNILSGTRGYQPIDLGIVERSRGIGTLEVLQETLPWVRFYIEPLMLRIAVIAENLHKDSIQGQRVTTMKMTKSAAHYNRRRGDSELLQESHSSPSL